VGTLNRNLAVVPRILKLSAQIWRDEQSGLTCLAVAPMINLESKYKKRRPYPLGWDEQALLFPELAGHLQRMALFLRSIPVPDLGAYPKLGVTQLERMLRESFHRLLKKPSHVAILFHIRQHHRKPVRTHSRQQVGIPHIARQPPCHLPQKRVAGRPAEAVIDILEPFQIDQEQDELVLAADSSCACRARAARETGCDWRVR
jgi:hypothetical protein